MSNDISEALGGDFDAESIPIPSYEPIPAGWYAAEIDAAKVQDNNKNTGKLLYLEYVALNEPYAGRRVFQRINLSNPNAQAVEIGQRELAALSMACGITSLRDSAELLQKQIDIKLKVKKDEGREPENAVVGYRPLTDAAPAASKPAAAKSKPAAAPSTPGKRPWER